MSLRINNLRLPVEQSEEDLLRVAARKLRLKVDDLGTWRILRKSLDAQVATTYDSSTFRCPSELPDESGLLRKLKSDPDVTHFVAESFDDPLLERTPSNSGPSWSAPGPAGLLAAYFVTIRGYQPIILRRGTAVKERVPAVRLFDRAVPHDPETTTICLVKGSRMFYRTANSLAA
ncbi:MAG: hypothetical protein R3C01_16440 [Planctomycetaceae bacterium]